MMEKKLTISTVVDANIKNTIDKIYDQYKTLKKLKNRGALFVLKKEIELLNMWLEEIK